ncbi:peroxisomal N(1)-acetyl-spermine/spermidine oxidase-like [Oratosquilla oratoria]|uniref:peroxisomal N(1)-acetyl-spermine/spermidine oxidase-like n=1 Tax=Oratosquilla oratoria TaxID=337810 RepID=UPI003F76B50F
MRLIVLQSFVVALALGQQEEIHPCAQEHLSGNNITDWMAAAERRDVIIVGGGVSGLTALDELLRSGVTNVLLLEAQDQLGGRIKTVRTKGVVVEDGAEWIHGDKRNPLFRLALDLGSVVSPMSSTKWDVRFRNITGKRLDMSRYEDVFSLWYGLENFNELLPYYGDTYGKYYQHSFPAAWGPGYNSTEAKSWLQALKNLITVVEGVPWTDVSARDVDQFIDLGEDYQWYNGFDTLLTYLQMNIPKDAIRTSTPVCKIYWNLMPNSSSTEEEEDENIPESTLVVTADGSSFVTKVVLVTTSIGYLKEHHNTLFLPPLPKWKLNSIEGMGLGVANKIHIGWTKRWWGPKPLDVYILSANDTLPKEMKWLYGVTNFQSIRGNNAVLQCIVGGEDSVEMEKLPEDTVKEHVMYLLVKIMQQNISEPILFRRTQWSKNIWTRGSYGSYITIEGDKNGIWGRYDIGAPLAGNRHQINVLFAGEHTHPTRFATVDGAMDSGLRGANDAMMVLCGGPCNHV